MAKRVVIIGAGFGGLSAAKTLVSSNYEVILIDKNNYHLFQPLLYQVAAAALSPGDIAIPIRSVFGKYKNIKIYMDEVLSIDKDKGFVRLESESINFDFLIAAPGSRHSYFGKNEWEQYAPGIKTLSDALYIRERILFSLEQAERLGSSGKKNQYLTFVIVGGGPTGVELAGAIAEIAKKTMMKDFKNINSSQTKIYLIEASDRILQSYPAELSASAKEALESLGVEVKLNTEVIGMREDGVELNNEFISSANVIWAAGNNASPLIESLKVQTDNAGRAVVKNDLSIQGYPNIFVIGDAARTTDRKGSVLPGVAPVAIQQGKYVAKLLIKNLSPSERKPFKYFDRGNMAAIGRAKAVAEIRSLKLKGIFAWLAWCFVHIWFLIGFRNRFRVMAEWMWYYITYRHGIRLITGKPMKDISLK